MLSLMLSNVNLEQGATNKIFCEVQKKKIVDVIFKWLFVYLTDFLIS